MKNLSLFFLAIVSLSQSPNFIRWAQAPALIISFWRMFGAALLLILIHFVMTRRNKIPFWTSTSINGVQWALLTGVFFFVHLWSYAFGAQHTSVANCMVLFALNPIFTAIGSHFLLRDKFERQHAIAFILAFIGIYWLASENLNWEQGLNGKAAALLSGALYSGYALSGKKARLEMETSQLNLLAFSTAALLFFLTSSYAQEKFVGYPSNTWISVIALILIPTFCGHWVFTYLLKHMNINFMSSGKLAEPALAALMAYLVFDENISLNTVIAFGFALAAILVLIFGRKNRVVVQKAI